MGCGTAAGCGSASESAHYGGIGSWGTATGGSARPTGRPSSIAWSTVALADAQTAGSFDELQRILNRGDRVRVTDHTGRELTGRLVDLSPSSLSLEVEGARRDLLDADVTLVHQWRPDPLGTVS